MRLLFIIDHFGSGGAQRQMVELACALKQRGHDVEMLIYFPRLDFFRSKVVDCRIPVHECDKGRGFSFSVLMKLISLMRNGNFEIVLSYLDSPNIYAELATLCAGGPKLVVSERTSYQDDRSAVGAFMKRNLHRLADSVVANSISQRDWLIANHAWLKAKCVTIYNGLDTSLFNDHMPGSFSREDIRLIAIGRVGPEKNLLNLIKGLRLFFDDNGWMPAISWVGRREASTSTGQAYCQQVDELLDAHLEVKRSWKWLGERSDIPELLLSHHALILPSFFEGLPNVVCEALASGRPVLASNVCDNGLLVPDGERGFLFDPDCPESIAAAIERIVALQPDDWQRMSKSASQYAKESLTINKMVNSYEDLFQSLIEADH